MRLTVSRETLLTPLQLVIGAVERKQTLPILSNVLIQVKDQLSIIGTDLEVELIGKQSLEHTSSPGAFTVPGRKLFDILKALPEEAPIEMHSEKERVILRSGRSRFTLSTLPAQDFPQFEANKKHLSFSLPHKDLLHLIQQTYFSMAQQDVRYYLNGMLFEAGSNSLRAVATDGHRLATHKITAVINEAARLQIIVPRKGIIELLRLLEEEDREISVIIGSNFIKISDDRFTFTSKLIEGRFPDYNRVIPKSTHKQVVIEGDALKQALIRSAILCNEKFRGVRFELREGLLRLSANNPEHEAAEEEITVEYHQGDLDIGFNVNYLLDILNAVPPGPITLSFTDNNSSALIETSGKDKEALFVVMPMRL
ncbi:MAG TPA: DNA polymerase III subunit beta [Coxiellaceae bacterium]|nr:DNA polymerase III subunit beta [Coxiellaceae bacterium]